MPKTILVVDDDSHIREILRFSLEKAGFRVFQAADGAQGLVLAQHAADMPDLVILDISMPEMDGLEVCRELRRNSEIPILFLSSRDDEVDRVVGLEIGGDDYLTKPFSPRELVARVKGILRRASPPVLHGPPARVWQRGALRADLEAYTAYWNDALVALTLTEFLLLTTMLRRQEKVYGRDDLMEAVYDDVTVSDRTIDSHIRRIRQKFSEAGAPQIIETVHGVGYKLGPCEVS